MSLNISGASHESHGNEKVQKSQPPQPILSWDAQRRRLANDLTKQNRHGQAKELRSNVEHPVSVLREYRTR